MSPADPDLQRALAHLADTAPSLPSDHLPRVLAKRQRLRWRRRSAAATLAVGCAVAVAAAVAALGWPGASSDVLRTAQHPSPAGGQPATISQPTVSPAQEREAQIDAALIRQLAAQDNTVYPPEHHWPALYVLDRTVRDLIPQGGFPAPTGPVPGPAISAPVQRRIVALLADYAPVQFVSNRENVLSPLGGVSARVKNDGVLITLGSSAEGGNTVQVAATIFVSPLAGYGTTYVLEHQGTGWVVTGKTGVMFIA